AGRADGLLGDRRLRVVRSPRHHILPADGLTGRRTRRTRMLYGSEKAWGETDWKRRLGYRWLGELHIPGRLRSWLIVRALRRLGFDPSDYGHVRAGYSEDRLRELFGGAGLEVESVRRTFGPAGTLMFDLFFVTGDSRPHPLVYLALFPVYMLLAAADVFIPA